MADYREIEKETRKTREGGEQEKGKGNVWMRKREGYVGRNREKGKTWSSKRQSSIPRRRAPVYLAICI